MPLCALESALVRLCSVTIWVAKVTPLDAGDLDGQAVWKRIIRALDNLQSADGPDHINELDTSLNSNALCLKCFDDVQA